jgi:hypothetical protein
LRTQRKELTEKKRAKVEAFGRLGILPSVGIKCVEAQEEYLIHFSKFIQKDRRLEFFEENQRIAVSS